MSSAPPFPFRFRRRRFSAAMPLHGLGQPGQPPIGPAVAKKVKGEVITYASKRPDERGCGAVCWARHCRPSEPLRA